VPPEAFDQGAFAQVKIVEGSLEAWKNRADAALVGKRVASRRGLKIGDRVEISGTAIYVAGIIESSEPQDQNAAYTQLDFTQRAADNELGVVTQFDVVVTDPSRLDAVAKAIDEEFRTAQEPTATWSEKSFVARATSDLVEIINFTKWLGWGCVVGVFALVFNAIVLSVQDRIKDHAIMHTLGYSDRLIAGLIIAESSLLSMCGAFLGVTVGWAVMTWGHFSVSVEGLSINIHAGPSVIATGLVLAAITGVTAGLVPAWQAAGREIAECFRAV
jgi:putative ABC transport system permease protein